MCYGCQPTCENCKPKFVACPECGWNCWIWQTNCKKCGAELTEESKELAYAIWHEKHMASE